MDTSSFPRYSISDLEQFICALMKIFEQILSQRKNISDLLLSCRVITIRQRQTSFTWRWTHLALPRSGEQRRCTALGRKRTHCTSGFGYWRRRAARWQTWPSGFRRNSHSPRLAMRLKVCTYCQMRSQLFSRPHNGSRCYEMFYQRRFTHWMLTVREPFNVTL